MSATQLPLFWLRPPPNYGLLVTSGRRSGNARRRCVRAVRRGDSAILVAIRGEITGWARNIRANHEVKLRLRDGWFRGIAREPIDEDERREALDAYCEAPAGWFERSEYRLWRSGRPSTEEMEDLHRTWFHQGTPFVIDLDQG